MAEIIIVNPSDNLLLLGKAVQQFGGKVRLVETDDFTLPSFRSVRYFFGGSFQTVRKGHSPIVKGNDRALAFRKTLLTFTKGIGIKHDLKKLHPSLGAGHLGDLVMLGSGHLTEVRSAQKMERAKDVASICAAHPQARVVTGFMLSASGTETATLFTTDFDVHTAFGNDYFVVFHNGIRIECFGWDGRLVAIAPNGVDVLKAVLSEWSFLSAFHFEKAGEVRLTRNHEPWYKRFPNSPLFLVNDYSFFTVSAHMQAAWYERLGRLLCSEKLR